MWWRPICRARTNPQKRGRPDVSDNQYLQMKNSTTKLGLVSQSRKCTSALSKAIGLMFSRPLEDRGLIFVFNQEQRTLLHMLFVFFPIDIIYLNSRKEVVQLVQGARPFQLSIRPEAAAKYILELPADTIRKSKTKIGHKIAF